MSNQKPLHQHGSNRTGKVQRKNKTWNKRKKKHQRKVRKMIKKNI